METPTSVITAIFWLLGGLALFLTGIDMMGKALRRGAGPFLRSLFDYATRTRFRGVTTGAVLTALMQSSSASTVMVVGFINAGLLRFENSIGLILGANIGTTITPKITAFDIDAFALPMLGCGFLLSFLSSRRIVRQIGYTSMGFGMLFFGLMLMKASVSNYHETIHHWLNMAAEGGVVGALLAFLVAAGATAIIQSSAASIVMIQALAFEGVLTDINVAIPLIAGAQVGTCATALLASLQSSLSAKRAALAHFIFNVAGVIITLAFYRFYVWFIPGTSAELPHQIANGHFVMKLVNVALFIPFAGLYAKGIMKLASGTDKLDATPRFLSYKHIGDPERAFSDVGNEVTRMFGLCVELLKDSLAAFLKRDEGAQAMVLKRESLIDDLDLTVGDYLLKLAQRDMPPVLSAAAPLWMHVMGDVERIGDHAENIVEIAELRKQGRARFSQEAVNEIESVMAMVMALASSVERALCERQESCMKEVLERKAKINGAVDRYLDNHATRMEQGCCSVTSGMVFLELITNLRRVANHMRNIAASVTSQMPENSYRVQKLKQELREE
ncbi:MAG: Na/Pi cotransporter family protein [Verrucomicrobia bacterium]|jgi:phosphate:Na+ symporter|nr:Na/Pi cotransporter family protein [Verrucomicrobiota bacterium]